MTVAEVSLSDNRTEIKCEAHNTVEDEPMIGDASLSLTLRGKQCVYVCVCVCACVCVFAGACDSVMATACCCGLFVQHWAPGSVKCVLYGDWQETLVCRHCCWS